MYDEFGLPIYIEVDEDGNEIKKDNASSNGISAYDERRKAQLDRLTRGTFASSKKTTEGKLDKVYKLDKYGNKYNTTSQKSNEKDFKLPDLAKTQKTKSSKGKGLGSFALKNGSINSTQFDSSNADK